MSFISMFFTIFMTSYTYYKKIILFLFPLPKQMLIYDRETNRVMIRGPINWEIRRLAIDHFVVDGDYNIRIDGKSINCIKNRDDDDFRADKQYFLTSNHRYFKTPTTITITKIGNKKVSPPVEDVTHIWDIKPHTLVDFVAMIEDIGDDL